LVGQRSERVPLLGVVALNGGDAAIALGAVRFLEATAGREVVVLDRDPESTRLLYPELRIAPWATYASVGTPSSVPGKIMERLDRIRRGPAIRHADRPHGRAALSANEAQVTDLVLNAPFVAATGGTYLVDHYRWEARLPELALTMRAGRPLVILSQTMGPFERRSRGYRLLGAVFEHASVVLARDDRSVNAVRRLSPDARILLAPDMAFFLAQEESLPRGQPASSMVEAEGGPRIAVSVRSWPYLPEGADHTLRFRALMSRAVEGLVRRLGARVTFLSTCQGIRAYRFDDAEEADLIRSLLSPDVREAVHVDTHFHHATEFIEMMRGFDVVVAMRMHASIMSWLAGTPAVAIAYEPKTRELFGRHGQGHLVQDMTDLDPQELVSSVKSLLDAGGVARATVARGVSMEVERLAEVSTRLSALL
jgi:colanic acid/amylovoran biosynthesis protein